MTAPTITYDIYSDESLSNPYPIYEELRALGSAVWMEPHNAFVLPRYTACRDALRNWRVFASGNGVMMNDPMNAAASNQLMLCTDGERHSKLRSVVGAPLMTKALDNVRPLIETEAAALVDRLVAQRTFDAVSEFAQHLPVTIVSELVGLPEAGRERMLPWASAVFNSIGPLNQRGLDSIGNIIEMNEFVATKCTRDAVKPGGWAEALWDAVDRGDMDPSEPAMQLHNYTGPSLDTTINATSNMIWLFSQNPEQWNLLRRQPELIPNAIDEVLRLESPVQGFSRCTTESVDVDGITLPAGARVLMLYAAANRDERQFADPTVFDIQRANAGDHLGLGHGRHVCPGAHLARLEMRSLLNSLLPKVARFDLVESSMALNNTMRGLATCTVNVIPA